MGAAVTTNRDFAKQRVVHVVFNGLAELMVVTLSRRRGARHDDVLACDQCLGDDAAVDTSRVERFGEGLIRRRQYATSFQRPGRNKMAAIPGGVAQ